MWDPGQCLLFSVYVYALRFNVYVYALIENNLLDSLNLTGGPRIANFAPSIWVGLSLSCFAG